MIKTYKASTNVSINVVLSSKKNLHVSFVPLSNGSSTFTTDNEELIRAIESHYNFGKLFRLWSATDKNVKKQEEGPANEESDAEEEQTEDTLKEVTVSDLSAAKDYLADKLGISRTALRSKKAIDEQAAANGIKFNIL